MTGPNQPTAEINVNAIVTPVAILSFPHLFQVWKGQDNSQAPKYGATFIFDQATDISLLKRAALQVAREAFGKDTDNMIRTGEIHMPFRADGERWGYPEGSVFIGSSRHERFGAPGVYSVVGVPDPKVPGKLIPKRITADEQAAGNVNELYPGCKVRGLLSCYAYKTPKKGVSFGLNGIQKVGDGERLDNRVAGEDVFEASMAEQPASLDDLMK